MLTNYTKLKTCISCLLRQPARKWIWPILQLPEPTWIPMALVRCKSVRDTHTDGPCTAVVTSAATGGIITFSDDT